MTSRISTSHDKWVIEELRRDPAFAESYLETALEENDPHIFMLALRHLAEARGMSKVAEEAGIPRESLYRALSARGNPRWSTLFSILKATGVKMHLAAY
jgi:probable addiction module antidote protein